MSCLLANAKLCHDRHLIIREKMGVDFIFACPSHLHPVHTATVWNLSLSFSFFFPQDFFANFLPEGGVGGTGREEKDKEMAGKEGRTRKDGKISRPIGTGKEKMGGRWRGVERRRNFGQIKGKGERNRRRNDIGFPPPTRTNSKALSISRPRSVNPRGILESQELRQ